MKQHVHMFESFVSDEGPSYRDGGLHRKSDLDESASQEKIIAQQASSLLNELTMFSTTKLKKFMKPEVRSSLGQSKVLTDYLADREVSMEDFEALLDALSKFSFIPVEEKAKVDQDGDGDTDFVDAKIAQYQAGGIKKDIAIAKAKLFAKKNNIKDSKAPQNPKAKSSKRG